MGASSSPLLAPVRIVRRLLAVVVAGSLLAAAGVGAPVAPGRVGLGPGRAAAQQAPARPDPPPLRRPVRGAITDHFRSPSSPYGAGNRGLEFAATEGEAVLAAAPGRVSFAGHVAAALWVVVEHADGYRTSYGPLASTAVHAGDALARGQPLGTAGATLHLGLRHGSTYVDPEPWLLPLEPARPRHAVLVALRD